MVHLSAPPQLTPQRLTATTWAPLSTQAISFYTGLSGYNPSFPRWLKSKAKLESILEENALSRDDAGKLRGDINWLFTMCMGHLGKIAGPALTAHQHGDAPIVCLPRNASNFRHCIQL